MTRTVVSLVSAISWAERIWSQLDWAEIRRIIRDGLVAFVALSILAFLYTVEGVRSFYRWAQPRLANLLQHPAQTMRNGPGKVFDESIAAVLTSTATPIEKYIVSFGSWFILTCDEVFANFYDVKYKASRFKIWMMGPSIRLDWGNVSYSMVAWNRGHLSIWGQRMG